MKNNVNMVKIVTNDESVMRKLAEITKEPYVVTVSLEKPEVMDLFKSLIMEERLETIHMFPIKETEDKEVKEDTKEEPAKPIQKKDKKEGTVKERLYDLIQEKGEVKNSEIIAELGIDANLVSRYLKQLAAEGKIEKIKVGHWRKKEAKDGEVNSNAGDGNDEKSEKKKEGESPPEKKDENYEVLRQKVLALFQKGWKLTEDEIVEKLNIAKEDLNKILKELICERLIVKEDETYKIYTNPFGVFEDENFQILLDFIMGRNYFFESQVIHRFPKEYKKLDELMERMGKNYLRRDMASPEKKYDVILKGRILYFFLKNPRETLVKFEKKYQNVSKKDIVNAIEAAIKNGELKKLNGNQYETIKM